MLLADFIKVLEGGKVSDFRRLTALFLYGLEMHIFVLPA